MSGLFCATNCYSHPMSNRVANHDPCCDRNFTVQFVLLKAYREAAIDANETPDTVTCAIMCQAGKGYSLWLCKSHEQEHPDVTANCDD